MLLAIDIGNTNVTLGIFKISSLKGGGKSPRGRSSWLSAAAPTLVKSWRISTLVSATTDEYGTKILDLFHYAAIERLNVKAAAIASVVPSLTSVFQEIAQTYFNLKPFVVGENTKVTIANLYENPKEVGADRILNAVAASAKFGTPCVVVDFGTATTFDCVTKKGEYAGGLIVPGPILASESLSLHTAKLPKVGIEKPGRLIGRTTVESIQSGLYYGYVSLVDGVIERLKQEMGNETKVVATGGLAALLSKDSKFIQPELIFPHLTLEGLCMLWEKNQ
ncbi:MAG: type III pantothenate kinase [Elusimicrobia bacterium]|nr:type III pantothenate kinase [Elusimicrobiota bacterium]